MSKTHSMLGEIRNTYKILVEKPERKRPLRTPRQRWEDTIKMDLKEIGLHTTGSYLEPVESSPHVYTLVSLGPDVLFMSTAPKRPLTFRFPN
jgi:hypothetical protein